MSTLLCAVVQEGERIRSVTQDAFIALGHMYTLHKQKNDRSGVNVWALMSSKPNVSQQISLYASLNSKRQNDKYSLPVGHKMIKHVAGGLMMFTSQPDVKIWSSAKRPLESK